MNERMVTGMTSVTPMALPTSMKSRSPTSMPSTAMTSGAICNSSLRMPPRDLATSMSRIRKTSRSGSSDSFTTAATPSATRRMNL